MSLGQSIRRSVSWLMFGSTGEQVLQFLIGIVLARLLTPADFGMVVTVQVFTGFMGMLLSAGMGQSLIRAKEAEPVDFNTVFTMQLIIGALIFAGFYVVAPWLAAYLGNALYADLIRVSALSFLLRPMSLIRTAWLSREMQFKKRALVMLASSMLTGLSSIGMAVAGLGVWSLILSGLLGALASNVMLRFATPLRLRLELDRSAARRHSGFGLKITTNEFLTYLKDQSINLILSKLAGPAAVGLFNKAEGLARLPNRLITPPTGQAVFRAMSKVQDNLDKTKYLFHHTVALLSIYIFPTLVILWWVTEPLIEVLYGRQWLPAAEPMKILIVAAFFRPIRTPCGVVLAAQNQLSRETVALVVSLLLTVGGCIVGLRWGLAGVAWSLLVNGILLAGYYYVLVYRTLQIRWSELARALAPGLSLGLIAAFTLAGFHHGVVGPLKANAPIVYVGAMGIVGTLAVLAGFFCLPFETLRLESRRWLQLIRSVAATALHRPVTSGGTGGGIGPNPAGNASVAEDRRPGADAPADATAPDPVRRSHEGPMSMRAGHRRSWLTVSLILALALIGTLAVLRYARPAGTALVEWPLPMSTVERLFDIGVVDANDDGRLDIYTSNHHFRQAMLIAQPDGSFRDTVSDWGLDQSREFAFAEPSFVGPALDRPGLYIYWFGTQLLIQAHEISGGHNWDGVVRVNDEVDILKNEGFSAEKRDPASKGGETVIRFRPGSNGVLRLNPGGQGLPISFEFGGAAEPGKIYVGRGAVSPRTTKFVLAMQDRHALAWADYNGDGRKDLFINRGGLGGTLRAQSESTIRAIKDELFLSQPGGTFLESGQRLGIEKKGCSGRHARWLDVDNDGRLDLFVNCYDRGNVDGRYPKQLYRQDDKGMLHDVADALGLGLPNQQIAGFGWFDADADGDLDLLAFQDEGLFLYRSAGGRYTQEAVLRRATDPADRIGRRLGEDAYYDGKFALTDFDADGDVDAFSPSRRGNVLLVNEGGRFRTVDPASVGLPGASIAASWIDIDNDGLPDLHLVPQGIYRQLANHVFERTGLLELHAGQYDAAIVNWFDRDNDGRPDLLLALHETPGFKRWWEFNKEPKRSSVWDIKAYRNTVPGGRWLQVKVRGGQGNPQAIGARVTVVTPAGPQTQEVGMSEGAFFSQGHYRLYFGLGPEGVAREVKVRWPDGREKRLVDVAADQFVMIEPGTTP